MSSYHIQILCRFLGPRVIGLYQISPKAPILSGSSGTTAGCAGAERINSCLPEIEI